MLHDATRHEALIDLPWDEHAARATMAEIVADAEARWSPDTYWPSHPLDAEGDAPSTAIETPLYFGACGVMWALHYLRDTGAVTLARDYAGEFPRLLERNRAWLGADAEREKASYLMGETPIRLMAFAHDAGEENADALAALIAGNVDHPAREMLWGAPGTLLAALFLHERTGDGRWADLYRATAQRLHEHLHWSDRAGCAYWTQDMYGRRSTYLGAAHGFVGVALPLIHGRHLLSPAQWDAWQDCIVGTVARTAERDGDRANWPLHLEGAAVPDKRLVQYCHGAPGFVICLGDLPTDTLDDLLVAAGEATWQAGPLAKGANLCHGTGGNGYAFLKLYVRTGDRLWLTRARAFAMHGIAQVRRDRAQYGQGRYSLWTGDPGFAIYLWDCLHGRALFPTLDIFHADR